MTSTSGYRVSEYHQHRVDGSHIRVATRVECPDGTVIEFMERMSKREAIRNAQYQQSKGVK